MSNGRAWRTDREVLIGEAQDQAATAPVHEESGSLRLESQTKAESEEPLNVLLFDLVPESQIAQHVSRLLQSCTEPGVHLHSARVDWSRLPRASSALTASLRDFVPDVSFFVVAAPDRELWSSLFREYHAMRLEAPLIAVLTSDDLSEAERVLTCGATDFLLPPIRPIDLLPRLRHVWTCRPQRDVAAQQLKESLGLKQLVGDSPAFLAEIRKIPAIARSEASVLISGETGTGKEICARAIHYLSQRAGKPFVSVNCAGLPADLVENELFGHEPGAFTGANAATTGFIQAAQGGTLFLDEVDALPLPAQAKLLRFLQDKEYVRLGSGKMQTADERVIAATNIRLQEAVRAGRFRADLYYRLNVVSVELPPLRARGEDIVQLARHFLVKVTIRKGKPPRHLSTAALRKLQFYDWPGNVRELENAIERSVTLSDNPTVESKDIYLPSAEIHDGTLRAQKAAVMRRFEIQYLKRALRTHSGNVTQAARAAGKERSAFRKLLRKYQIKNLTTTPQPHGTGLGPSRLQEYRAAGHGVGQTRPFGGSLLTHP